MPVQEKGKRKGSTFCSLLKSVFTKRASNMEPKTLYFLRARAAMFSIAFNSIRTILIISQTDIRFEALQLCSEEVKVNCLENYNEGLVDSTKEATKLVICVLPILTLFFAFLSLKKKQFADWLMSLETLLIVVMSFRPMYSTTSFNYYFI